MSCDVTKFVISKGSDNTFVFTIKQDDSTLALVIDITNDTFFADLINLEDRTTYPEVTKKALTVLGDGSAGRVALTIPKADTANMVIDRGGKVDRYYPKPTYKLILDCSTTNNGDFIAKVPEVYVD